ncbi:MAG: hypothetical protein EXR60_03725 [Dehalococcoidia bacterium]|nr:hypothetical protein [Dehalococcoidia bacterium]
MEGLAESLGAVEFFAKLVLSWLVLSLGLAHMYRLGRQPWQDSALAFLLVAASFMLFDSLDIFGHQAEGPVALVRLLELGAEVLLAAALFLSGIWWLSRILRQRWQDSALALLAIGMALLLLSGIRSFF